MAYVNLPSPGDFGWKLSEDYRWLLVWMMLLVASKACTELVKCSCKSSRGCGGRCAKFVLHACLFSLDVGWLNNGKVFFLIVS